MPGLAQDNWWLVKAAWVNIYETDDLDELEFSRLRVSRDNISS